MAMTPQTSQITDTPNESLAQIEQVARSFETAVPNPSDRNAHTQLGVHFEEAFEMTQALRDAGTTPMAQKQLTFVADVLSYFQRQLKGCDSDLEIAFDKVDREALLEALCGQIVSTVGIAHMLGMDIEGALREGVASKVSKVWKDGQLVPSEQRKIMKGPRYRSPDLGACTLRQTHRDG